MKRLITLLLPALLALTACSLEDSGQTSTLKAGETMASFTVDLPNEFSGPQGYALAIDNDKAVSEFHVLAFDDEDNLADWATQTDITVAGDTPSFNVKFKKLTIGKAYTFVVLANAGKQVDALSVTFSSKPSYQVLMPKFIQDDGGGSNVTRIPMWGEDKVASLAGNNSVTGLKLLRMMARINVSAALEGSDTFIIEDVRLINYRPEGRIVPDKGNIDAGKKAIAPTLTDKNRVTGPLFYNFLSGAFSIYTFEADVAGSVSAPDLEEAHCLVIGAKYNSGAKSYYRVNFSLKDGAGNATYLPLLRNHSYNITITGVNGDGYVNWEDAFKSKGLSVLEAEIIEWNDADMTEIDFDGQYMLSISKKGWTFDKEARTTASTDNIIKIVTDWKPTWTISDKSTWLNLEKDGSDNWHLTVEENKTTSPRNGEIIIKAGRITSKITVTQSATAATTPVEGVNLTPSSLVMFMNAGTEKLNVEVLPATATNKTVTWSSNPNDVVSIAADGTLTALKNGTTEVTVTTADGSKTAKCTVTVKTAVTGLNLTPSSASVEVGNIVTLIPTIAPTDASDKTVSWSSNPTGIVTINNGVVTGISAGTTIVTATTVDGNKTATCEVTVTAPVPVVTTITLPTSAILGMTQNTLTLTPVYTPSGSHIASWNSTDESVATVANGVVTAKKVGTTQITATVGTVTSNICYLTVTSGTPGTMKGWAGSNIYWDGTKMTFDDEYVSDNQSNQGLYFKWGSLIGLEGTAGTITYTLNAQSNTNWGNVTTITEANLGNLPDSHYLTEQTSKTSAHGDICRYMTLNAPGERIHGKKWRMPTANELKNMWATGYSYSQSQPSSVQPGNAGGTVKINYVVKKSGNGLPASGSRDRSSGAMDLVGQYGYYWSASPNGTYGYNLYFHTGAPYLNHLTRSSGFSVRCVVED